MARWLENLCLVSLFGCTVGENITVPMESLDAVIGEEVLLLIADVEGWEAEVG